MRIIRKICDYMITRHYVRKGYSRYYVDFWRKEMKKSYKTSELPKKEKKWAYERGFSPYRILQYGLTEENYKSVISDRDYYYLYPLNNQYSRWIDDKLTMKYVLAPFDRFLPRYYYHLLKSRDVMRLMDCPVEYGASVDDVIHFLDEKQILAAKMSAGTYGIGFYKLESRGSVYYANGKAYTRDEFSVFLSELDDYIITEFVDMHPALKKINPCSVNTIRVVVINEHGHDPVIPFAFMRIGTKASGVVDNVAQGGMVCKIDVDKGRFYDGEVLRNHVYASAEYHPDTNERLEGDIPNWDIVKEQLIKMSLYCPQLKWLGYDIAITQDGFSIIEINSHQGLHKAHEYPETVKAFLAKELQTKKKRYHQI